MNSLVLEWGFEILGACFAVFCRVWSLSCCKLRVGLFSYRLRHSYLHLHRWRAMSRGMALALLKIKSRSAVFASRGSYWALIILSETFKWLSSFYASNKTIDSHFHQTIEAAMVCGIDRAVMDKNWGLTLWHMAGELSLDRRLVTSPPFWESLLVKQLIESLKICWVSNNCNPFNLK